MSKIAAYNFSPAVSYAFSDKFSLGIALDVYYAMFDMKRMDRKSLGQYSESSSGTGVGATFGLKYNFNKTVSAGLSYRTPVNVSMNGTATVSSEFSSPVSSNLSRDVTWPTWVGAGANQHINNPFSFFNK